MKVMSIDGSTKSSGWAIFENKQLVASGFVVSTNKNTLTRIKEMQKMLRAIYDQYLPDEIVMEDVMPEDVHNSQTAFKPLMYLQGAMALEFNEVKKEIHFYVSSEWRKLCGIKTGRGIKREVLKAAAMQIVKEKYNIDSNDDECDAICIGYAYSHSLKVSNNKESAF